MLVKIKQLGTGEPCSLFVTRKRSEFGIEVSHGSARCYPLRSRYNKAKYLTLSQVIPTMSSSTKPFLLYTGTTPNGYKVSVALEELKAVYGSTVDYELVLSQPLKFEFC